jgi:hypothetical protein
MTVKPYVCHSVVAGPHCPSGLNLILIVSQTCADVRQNAPFALNHHGLVDESASPYTGSDALSGVESC